MIPGSRKQSQRSSSIKKLPLVCATGIATLPQREQYRARGSSGGAAETFFGGCTKRIVSMPQWGQGMVWPARDGSNSILALQTLQEQEESAWSMVFIG